MALARGKVSWRSPRVGPATSTTPASTTARVYYTDQFWVQYLEGDLDGTTGLHIMVEIRQPKGPAK